MRISDWSSDVCSSDLVAGQVAGLNLSQGLSGFATCDGETVLLPLVSQSGMEKMTVRLWLSGRYTAEMRVELADPALRSEEHTSELQSLMRSSYAVFCSKNHKPSPHSHSAAPIPPPKMDEHTH